MVERKQAAPSKPYLTDEYEATNERLWQSVLDVAQGLKKRLEISGRTINAPNNGRGFSPWPHPNGTAWSVKQYKGFGGGWRLKEAKQLSLLAGGAVVATKTATVDHTRMQKFQRLGLVCSTTKAKWHYWEFTAKGAQFVKAMHRRTQG